MVKKIQRELAGKSNRIILSNLRRLATRSISGLVLPMPIIPGKNDDMPNLESIARLAASLKISRWDLLRYHAYGLNKHEQLHLDESMFSNSPHSLQRLTDLEYRLKALFAFVNTKF